MYFRYGFNIEMIIKVIYGNGLIVQQVDIDIKKVFVYIGQIRNIIGIFIVCIIFYLFVGLLYNFFYLGNRYFFVYINLYYLFFGSLWFIGMVKYFGFYWQIFFLGNMSGCWVFQFFQFGNSIFNVVQ